MKDEKLCDKMIENMLKDPNDLSPELLSHIDSCADCKAELEKIRRLDSFIKSSAPAVPSLKESVLAKIAEENIIPAPAAASSRRTIPFGTLAAAAAVLAVGILVYKGDILQKVDNASNQTDMIYVADQEYAPEAALEETKNLSADKINYALYDASSNNTVLKGTGSDRAENEIVEDIAETESEESAFGDAATNDAVKENNDTVTEGSNGGEIVEKKELLSLAPPTMTSDNRQNGSDTTPIDDTEPAKAEEIKTTSGSDHAEPITNDDEEQDIKTEAVKSPAGAGGSGSSGGSGAASGGGSSTSVRPQMTEQDNSTERLTTAFDFAGFLSDITEDSDAAEVFKVIEQFYPERITRDAFEQAGNSNYLAFVMSIDDFDSEYTEESLLAFCGKISYNIPYEI